jgi:hypothetical protein
MNLIAHAHSTGSPAEADFLAEQWAWLLGDPAPASPAQPHWISGEQVEIPLQPSSARSLVLFRESVAPGWSARLVWPGGQRAVSIDDSELDYMLIRLDGVPAGARLVFKYGPTLREMAWWTVSGLDLLVLLVWVLRPGALGRVGRRLVAGLRSRRPSIHLADE